MPPSGPVPGHGGEVDAEVLGAACAPAAWPAARPPAGRVRRPARSAACRCGSARRASAPGSDRRGRPRRPTGAATGGSTAPLRGRRLASVIRGAVADQHGGPAAGRRAADQAGLDRALLGRGRDLGRTRCRARRLGGAAAASAPAPPSVSTAMIGVPTSTVWPSGTSSSATTPAYGDGQLDQRLGRLDLDDDVVDLDGVAGLDLPGDDLGLGQALADVGQAERSALPCVALSQYASERSTASSTRSRSGRKSSSSLLGG